LRRRFNGTFDADRRGVKFKFDENFCLSIRARVPRGQVEKFFKWLTLIYAHKGGGGEGTSCTPSKDFEKLDHKSAIKHEHIGFSHKPKYPVKEMENHPLRWCIGDKNVSWMWTFLSCHFYAVFGRVGFARLYTPFYQPSLPLCAAIT
jgi:hypothetical protein